MAKTEEEIVIDKMFSVGFLQDKGKNKTPDYYADALYNIRILNGGITSRLGNEEIYNAGTPNKIQGIITNSILSDTRIYYVSGGHFRYIDLAVDPVVSTDVGDIGATGKCRFIVYGAYIIILTGNNEPRWYNGTLTQVTTSELTDNVNPQFGVVYAGFTLINSQLNKNICYYSRPITLANQNYCYDWLGTGAWTIDLKSKLLGMVANLNAVWFFTAEKILRMDKSNIATTGGVTSPYAIEFAQGYELASPDSIVNPGQIIMFLTSNKKIGSINYEWTVMEPQMKIISDNPGSSIDGFMQTELADDQSQSFAFYDKRQNLAKWWVKSRTSTVPDICLIYDLQNKTFLIDYDKPFSCITTRVDDIYAGSSLSHRILQDEIGDSDCWEPIHRLFETTDVTLGAPVDRKSFTGMKLAGQINSLAVIDWTTYVDDNLAFSKQINGNSIAGTALDGIGSFSIGAEPIGGDVSSTSNDLVDFEKRIGVNNLRLAGKKIKSIFSGAQVGQSFILDYFSLKYKPRKRPDRADTTFN